MMFTSGAPALLLVTEEQSVCELAEAVLFLLIYKAL